MVIDVGANEGVWCIASLFVVIFTHLDEAKFIAVSSLAGVIESLHVSLMTIDLATLK